MPILTLHQLPLRARRASKALSKDETVLAASAATITASISSSALTSSQAPGGRLPSRASSSSIVSRLSRDKGGIVASSSSVSGISSKLNGNGGGVQGGKENNGINLAPRRVLGDVSNASKVGWSLPLLDRTLETRYRVGRLMGRTISVGGIR